MSADLQRLASASRRFLDELTRHDAQYRDPGYDRDMGASRVTRSRTRAQSGPGRPRESLGPSSRDWTRSVEMDSCPLGRYRGEAKTLGSDSRIHEPGRNGCRRNHRVAGPRDSHRRPQAALLHRAPGPEGAGSGCRPRIRDQPERMLGNPSVLGVKLRHGDVATSLDASGSRSK